MKRKIVSKFVKTGIGYIFLQKRLWRTIFMGRFLVIILPDGEIKDNPPFSRGPQSNIMEPDRAIRKPEAILDS